MSKSKFLNGLREALSGEVSNTEINNQLLYYEKYIEDEMRKGKTEAEVMGELGDPRLIARTIIETSGNNNSYAGEYYEEREEESDNKTEKSSLYKFQMNGILGVIIGILIIVLIMAVIFSLVSALVPLLIPIILILLAVSYFKKRG